MGAASCKITGGGLIDKAMERPTLSEVQSWPATVDVTSACHALGISKTWGYELIKLGEFPVRLVPVGRRRRVVTADLVRLLSPEGLDGVG